MTSVRLIAIALAAAAAACGDPFDHRLADRRLTQPLASEVTPEQSLRGWIGDADVNQVCFLDEYSSARGALDYYASRGYIAADMPLGGFASDVPEGALGVLTIREDRAYLALVPQRYLFEPSVCFAPDAMLRRSQEEPSHWVVEGDPLDWR